MIDSGASRHMTGYGDHLADVVQREFQEKVVFGDDARYVVKGTGDHILPVRLWKDSPDERCVACAWDDKQLDSSFSTGG